MSAGTTGIAESRHLEFVELAEGVWAALAREGGNARSNGGFVDLGGATLVIDTHMSPVVAGEVRLAAELITGQPIAYVFYTHLHLDHVFGAQAFDAGTRFISSEGTQALIAERTADTYAASSAAWPGQIAALEAAVANLSDPAQRAAQQRDLENLRELAASLADFQPRSPDITFSDRLTLHGSRRSAVLLQLGGGHSPDDAVLHLPNDGILFSGDLVVTGRHPFMGGGGNPHDWLRMLLRMQDELDPEIIVPGHGPLTDGDQLPFLRQYLSETERLVAQAIRAGASLDEAKQLPAPAPYSDWPGVGGWERNVEFIYRRNTA